MVLALWLYGSGSVATGSVALAQHYAASILVVVEGGRLFKRRLVVVRRLININVNDT